MKKITTHVADAQRLLATRYRFPLYRAWVASHTQRFQDLEDAIFPLLSAFDVDTAERWALEILAKIVGQPLLSDTETLRAFVKVRVLVNRSNGTIPKLARIIVLLFGTASMSERGTAHVHVEPDFTWSYADAYQRTTLVRAAKVGGVGMTILVDVDDAGYGIGYTQFSYCDGTTRTSDSLGFSEDDRSSGGSLAADF